MNDQSKLILFDHLISYLNVSANAIDDVATDLAHDPTSADLVFGINLLVRLVQKANHILAEVHTKQLCFYSRYPPPFTLNSIHLIELSPKRTKDE
jgi:hypothetical protein